jgi:hypothetical protein
VGIGTAAHQSVHLRATKVVRMAVHQAGDRCRFHISKSRTKKELIRMQIAMTRSGEKIFDIGIACVTLLTTRIVLDFLAALLLERQTCCRYGLSFVSKLQKSQKIFGSADKLFPSPFGNLFVGIVSGNDRCS